jgi:aminopeptidase YwaD
MVRHKLRDIQTRHIWEDLSYLTGEETQGRLSGTSGARKTANYLEQQLATSGYKTSFMPVDVPALRLTGRPTLLVGNHVFRHRMDFAELNAASSGGVAEGLLFVLHDGEDIDDGELIDKIVLITVRTDELDAPATADAAANAGVKALLVESGEPKWFHKSPNGGRNTRIPVLRVRQSVAEQLVHFQGESAYVALPLENRVLPCQNVIGYLPGTIDAVKTVVLTAHYDHVGDDPGGMRFPGAIDNASGVAILLELARVLAERRESLPFHVLVAFLTGEESGMIGAKQLLSKMSMPVWAAINIDSLGFEPSLFKMRTGHNKHGHWLADLAAVVIQDHGVETAWITGSEDSMAFQREGIDAIGIGQKPTLFQSVQIHSPMDSLENLYFDPVATGYSIFTEIIEQLIEKSCVIL